MQDNIASLGRLCQAIWNAKVMFTLVEFAWRTVFGFFDEPVIDYLSWEGEGNLSFSPSEWKKDVDPLHLAAFSARGQTTSISTFDFPQEKEVRLIFTKWVLLSLSLALSLSLSLSLFLPPASDSQRECIEVPNFSVHVVVSFYSQILNFKPQNCSFAEDSTERRLVGLWNASWKSLLGDAGVMVSIVVKRPRGCWFKFPLFLEIHQLIFCLKRIGLKKVEPWQCCLGQNWLK